jgi:predicted Zn-dependent protease
MKLCALSNLKKFSVVFALTLIGFSSNAQFVHNYTPRQAHSHLSKELIEGLEGQFEVEDLNMPSTREVRDINELRRSKFISKIHNGGFIKDDSLENYVDGVLNNLVERNSLRSYPKRVLVLASPHVNAVCYGQGIYAVTVGLLARVKNETQLAFILAHELAHDELGHIRTRIVAEADLDLEERAQEQTFKVISGKIVESEIEEFRKVLYDYTRHSRQNEIKADSMAIIFLRNAEYNEKEGASALAMLKSAQSPKYDVGAELFLPFHSAEFPFQDYWLNDRLTVFSKKYMGTFLYSADSIETHPSIDLRKQLLSQYISQSDRNDDRGSELSNAIGEMAAFETVESAYKNGEYDLCLYHALQLYTRYPNNSYLVSRIGKVMIDLYEAKDTERFYSYVAKYTLNCSDELKLINAFLYNLSQKEMGELTYRFMHNSVGMSIHEKDHYYILWKISSLTHNDAAVKSTSSAFKERFGAPIHSYKYR